MFDVRYYAEWLNLRQKNMKNFVKATPVFAKSIAFSETLQKFVVWLSTVLTGKTFKVRGF